MDLCEALGEGDALVDQALSLYFVCPADGLDLRAQALNLFPELVLERP